MRAFPDERDEVPTRGRLRGRFPELDSRSDGSLRVEERTDMGERYLVDMTTGEKIIPGSRRPDGTYRKEIRVRAGYVPLEERRTFQTRQQLSRNERQVPGAGNIPGFSPSAFPPGYSGIASPSGNGKRAPARKGEKKHGEKTPEEKTPAAKGKRCGDAETPNAREADDLCRDMQKLSVGVQEKDTPVSETDSLKKRVRNVKKKLKEIEALQQKVDAGQTLGAEQMGTDLTLSRSEKSNIHVNCISSAPRPDHVGRLSARAKRLL